MRRLSIVLTTLLLGSCSPGLDPAALVDPFIGSAGTGHVFVGANVPWGLVQLGPTNLAEGWAWCSGYNRSDSTILGFSHTHLSGTGMTDLCDITVMPVVGDGFAYARGRSDDPLSGPFSTFRHETESCSPGFYGVDLDRYGIHVELTATIHAGLHRYIFPASDRAAVLFDMENGSWNNDLTGWHLEAEGDRKIRGYRRSTVWADRGFSSQDGEVVYFEAEFSCPFDSFELFADGRYGRANFTTTSGQEILLKVGISCVDAAGAAANLAAELPGWDFEAVRSEARSAWNRELSRMEIHSADPVHRKIAYTSLYHALFFPSVFSDVDGRYNGGDGQIYRADGFTYYTNFSFWDTYRAHMPLYSILFPERYADMARSLIMMADHQGIVPVWPMMGIETTCMIGNPGIPVLADAVLKGFLSDEEALQAYQAMRRSALEPGRWQDLRMRYGFIPADIDPPQSVAYECEYALADAAVARVADRLGFEEDAAYFRKRSHSWTHLFDSQTGFIRPRHADGSWVEPFDPLCVDFGNGYCEGNAWQYSFLVPHDVDTLSTLFGGKEALLARLDSLFAMPSTFTGMSADCTGMIGQYVHGNEPGHQIIYLYSMLGAPRKAAALGREVLSTLYSALPEGMCGNEDMGQMSAWYLLSSMGLYQVEPAGGCYWLGGPMPGRTILHFPDGKSFTVSCKGEGTRYQWNGRTLSEPCLSYADIRAGGVLEVD